MEGWMCPHPIYIKITAFDIVIIIRINIMNKTKGLNQMKRLQYNYDHL